MKFKKAFWPIFRVVYFVCCIVDVTVLCLYFFPPKDGNVVHAVVGSLLINTLTLIIGWAFLPWPRPELAGPATKPAPVFRPIKNDLEDICGRQSLEDFLERRRAEKQK